MAELRIPLDDRDYTGCLLIFDKDGTLIDFDAMWGGWIEELARRLERAAGVAVSARLFDTMRYDPATRKVDPAGPLAISSMRDLRRLAIEVLREAGVPAQHSEQVDAIAWYIPDPVVLAKPLADLPKLFAALRARGMRLAIATTDDRAPTEATVAALGLRGLVDDLACGDDGLALKPAPDAALALCARLGVVPGRAAMIGDTGADLSMGRAAGLGLVVGVLSGVGTAGTLGPLADVLLPSVAELIPVADSR